MKKYILLIFLFVFAGCSFKGAQKDMWIKDASNSFESYSNYYLQGDTRLASVSLKRAEQSAKSSVNLTPLSKIYLGVCALHVAVFIDDKCTQYISIRDIVKNKNNSESYFNMLQKNFGVLKTEYLPEQYVDFANAMKKEDFLSAFKSIKIMPKTSSKLISASLMKEHLSAKDIEYIIDEASFSGYKKAVVRWLKFLEEKSIGAKRQKIEKMLHVLTN